MDVIMPIEGNFFLKSLFQSTVYISLDEDKTVLKKEVIQKLSSPKAQGERGHSSHCTFTGDSEGTASNSPEG